MQAIVEDIYFHDAFFIFSINKRFCFFLPSIQKMTVCSNSLSPSFTDPPSPLPFSKPPGLGASRS